MQLRMRKGPKLREGLLKLGDWLKQLQLQRKRQEELRKQRRPQKGNASLKQLEWQQRRQQRRPKLPGWLRWPGKQS